VGEVGVDFAMEAMCQAGQWLCVGCVQNVSLAHARLRSFVQAVGETGRLAKG